MDVLQTELLSEFWLRNKDAKKPLVRWLTITEGAGGSHLLDVRAVFPTADPVTGESGATATVFNIRGNRYRLITLISYPAQYVMVTHVLTHDAYDDESWKGDL